MFMLIEVGTTIIIAMMDETTHRGIELNLIMLLIADLKMSMEHIPPEFISFILRRATRTLLSALIVVFVMNLQVYATVSVDI